MKTEIKDIKMLPEVWLKQTLGMKDEIYDG